MAKQIRREDISVNDPFALIRESAALTKIQTDALMRDLEAMLPITKQVLEGKGADVKSIEQQIKAMEKLNAATRQAHEQTLQDIKVKEAATKAKIAEERLTQATIRTKAAETRERDKSARATVKSTKAEERLKSTYFKMQDAMSALSKRYRELAVKQELGIKLTAREELAFINLGTKIKKYDGILKGVDAQMGRHQRNVGNYASGFDGLGHSINQLTREAPAFANSMQTGFMAISNNIPMLFDELKRLKTINAELIAQGKPTQSMFKKVASSIFSWQTGLSLAVTLLTVFGAKIVDWFSSMSSANRELEKQNALIKKQNEERKKSEQAFRDEAEQLAKSTSNYFGLITALKHTNAGSKKRSEMITEINKQYGTTLQNIKDEKKFQDQLNESVTDYIAFKRAQLKVMKFDDLIVKGLTKEEVILRDLAAAREKLRRETELYVTNQRAKGIEVTQRDINIRFNESITTIQEYKERLEALRGRLESYGLNVDKLKDKIKGLNFEQKENIRAVDKAITKYKEFSHFVKKINDELSGGTDAIGGDSSRASTLAEIKVLEAEIVLELQKRAGTTLEVAKAEQELLKVKIEQINLQREIDIRAAEGNAQEIQRINLAADLEITKLKKVKEAQEEVIKGNKELAKLTADVGQAALKLLEDSYDRELNRISTEMELVSRQLDTIEGKAKEGQLLAQESLTQQIRLQRELAKLEQERLRKKQQLAFIQGSATAILGGGGGFDLSQIPSFFEGTEGTIGEATKDNIKGVSRDGVLARVDKREMILNPTLTAPIRKHKATSSEVVKGWLDSKESKGNKETNELLREIAQNKSDIIVGEVIQKSFDIIRKETKGNRIVNHIYKVKY